METTESSKQLGELLKQQQEPLVLQIYLSERGCLRSKKKGTSNFPKLLKLMICNKLFAIKRLKKTKISGMKRNERETAEPDGFSTVYNSCTDRDVDETLMIKKIPSSNGVQSRKSLFLSKLIMGDSILWNLLVQTTTDKPCCVRILQEADESNCSPFSISKRVLQQAKKIKEEKMKLVESDVMGSTQEWNGYEEQKKGIGIVIGNTIAEEIINEVVKEMVFMFHC